MADVPSELNEIRNQELASEMRIAGDWYDLWGAAMGWAFALADYISDQGGAVPVGLKYEPGMGGSDTSTYEYQALEDMHIPAADAEQAAEVLDKLLDRAKAEGRDY